MHFWLFAKDTFLEVELCLNQCANFLGFLAHFYKQDIFITFHLLQFGKPKMVSYFSLICMYLVFSESEFPHVFPSDLYFSSGKAVICSVLLASVSAEQSTA